MRYQQDEFTFRFTDHERSVSREFVGGRDFRVDHRAISRTLLVPLTARMVDLLRIAASVYFVDRLVRRDRSHGPETWARNISCALEVRDYDFWMSESVRSQVEEAVRFVSGDRWSVEFHPSSVDNPFVCEYERPLFFDDLGHSRRVCLYSGGLDSAAGLSKQLRDDSKAVTLAVNVQHRTDIGSTVNEQLKLLAKHTHSDVRPVIIPFEMNAPQRMVVSEEESQRARAFLFVATGGVVAGATHSSELEVFESGVGAINVPLLSGMEGSQATRGTHPIFLRLMSRLLSHVVDSSIEVVLPFLSLTKGEVTKSLNSQDFKDVAIATISCAHYPIRIEKGVSWKSCGLCPACIFRRLALHTAGIEEHSHMYQHDLLDPQSSEVNPKKLRYLLAYLAQVDSLAHLDDGKLPLNVTRHLRTTELLQSGESVQRYLDLFHRYRTEWHSLIEQARRNGCDWAHRIDLPGQAA